MSHWIRVAAAAALLTLLTGCGITAGRGAGFASFSPPPEADRVVGISLGALPLKLARVVMDDDDPEVKMILKELRGVRVFVYELDSPVSADALAPTLDTLDRKGWEPVVAVREDGETVHVLLKTDRHDAVRGMVVLAADGRELVMVNLMGRLRPEMFNAYMDDLSIDAPRVSVDST
ncbi:MAG: DUF4252 domain-containing protein [Pseudomonadota bacterium]